MLTMSMNEDCELLFFDTFSHDSCEDLNLDLVQFPRPVFLSEIRVIPLGARVLADFPGGHRLGATNPSAFQLEFFMNDLSRGSVTTFQLLGSLSYKQNMEIQFPVTNKIPTDGLVLRGLYSAVTLAIYGHLTKTSSKERSSPPPPPPPPPPQSIGRTQEHRPGSDAPMPSDWERHARSVDVSTEPPPIHSHAQAMVEAGRFPNVSSIIHPQSEQRVPYATEMPQPVYSEPPPSIVYPECSPASVPSLPPPPPAAYQQYDTRYTKPWPPTPEEHYPTQSDGYDSQVYRPSDPVAYMQPPATLPHQMWDPKDCHPSDVPGIHEHSVHSRSKDRREKPWDRDGDYKDDDVSRDRDSKRKERDHRSWERGGASDSDRYRDRLKESSGRDRDRDKERDRGRDKRAHDVYSDRTSRSSAKRPVTPPTPPSAVHSRPPQTPPDMDKIIGGPRTPKEEEPMDTFDDSGEMRGSHPNDYYEGLSPDRRMNEQMYNLSEGEIQEGDNTEDDDGYEEIVSEEEIMSDGEDHGLDMNDIGFDGEGNWNYMSNFSPFHCELTSCQHFRNPTLSEFDACKGKPPAEADVEPPVENRILVLLESFKDKEHTEKWVEALESIDFSILGDLLLTDTKAAFDDAIDALIDWVIEGLDFDIALAQPQTAYKVRHIKAGIRAAGVLFRTSDMIINKLLDREVPKLLLQLFEQPFMVLPVKLLILRTLDSVTYSRRGLSYLVSKPLEFLPPKDFDSPVSVSKDEVRATKRTGYQKLLEILLSKQLTRVVVAISALLEKIHLSEVLNEFHVATENLVQNFPPNEPKPSATEDVPTASATEDDPMPSATEDCPTPSATEEIPRPSVTEEAPTPSVKEEVPMPSIKEEVPSPSVKEEAPSPTVKEEPPSPTVKEEAPLPSVKEEPPLPSVKEEPPSPSVKEEPPSPSVKEEAPTPSSTDDVPAAMEIDESPSTEAESVDQHSEHVNLVPCEEDLHIIITCLNDITTSYRTAFKKLAQPKRLLPARNLIECPKSPFDPYPGILRMFKENHLLEDILSLLLNPLLVVHLGLMTAVRDLFLELLRSQSGLLFLLSMPEVMNNIQKILVQNLDESRDFNSDENMAGNLGTQIVYHLQALLYVDGLCAYHAKEGLKKEPDSHDVVSILHYLYSMIFSPVGQQAVVNVLSMEKNLTALLPFVQMIGEEEADLKLRKSVCAGYVTELLTLTVHNLENVSVLEKFSEVIFNLCQQENMPKLRELVHWVAPARKVQTYTHEDIAYLTGVLKSHLEDAYTLPPELITAVRILKYICLPADDDNNELKYTYAIIQLFSNDGLQYFLTIIQNVCETFLKPSHQSVALVGQQGVFVIALVRPIILMMKKVLSYLISCRGDKFQDLTAVSALLKIYSLMSMIPTSSYSYHLSSVVQGDIVEILLCYTQPCLMPEESEESLSNSLWTQMVLEVFKFIQQSPMNFVTGLSVLSELLPLPLPLQSRESIDANEISLTINHRKLWSAHLHPLSRDIQEIIGGLSGASCHPLQQLLRRVCIQLTDLAAPTALVITRTIVDSLIDAFEVEIKEVIDGSAHPPRSLTSAVPSVKACSANLVRILNFLAYLVSHSAFKIPFIYVLKASTKADEKYADVLTHLLSLLNFLSENPSHIQAQECIGSILLSLCDPYIGFISVENGALVNEALASCLPSKEQMLEICGALIQHVGNSSNHYASILPSLRSLVMLAEHDYGFYHVRQCLDQFPEVLRSLISRMSSGFATDGTECLSTLSTALEFLRLMVHGYEEGAQTGRSMLLPASELASWLSNPTSTQNAEMEEDANSGRFQSLLQLEKSLTECTTDEEAIEGLLDNISGLIVLLHEGCSKEDKTESKELIEPVLPVADNLQSQFALRTAYLAGEVDEDRLNPAYWLSVPVSDDSYQYSDHATTDLIAMAEKCLSGDFDLKNSLDNLCSSADASTELKKEECISAYNGKRKYSNVVTSGTSDGIVKRRFIAPMRGRGFSRATSHSSRANDPFRSRPPNTSRPPSMHVDDFVALESHHTGSGGQVQQKRQDGTRGRGRGFDRGQVFLSLRGSGGRVFNSPGPYGRRDVNTHIDTCNARGTATRISNSAWGSRTSTNLLKSSGPGARTNFSSRPSVSERCGYGSTFVSPEPRLTNQRNRDSYPNLVAPPSAVQIGRFSRGGRAATSVGASVEVHWTEARSKTQNQRFMTSMSPARGAGRRDLSTRHGRSFTR